MTRSEVESNIGNWATIDGTDLDVLTSELKFMSDTQVVVKIMKLTKGGKALCVDANQRTHTIAPKALILK